MRAHAGKHGAMSIFARLLFALVVTGLLGVGISATHAKPALASGACYPVPVLSTDTKVQTVSIPGGSYKITVHTALWSGSCEPMAETTVRMSQCQHTALSGCAETGAAALVVGSNGVTSVWTPQPISLSAPFLGSASPVSFFTPDLPVVPQAGAMLEARENAFPQAQARNAAKRSGFDNVLR